MKTSALLISSYPKLKDLQSNSHIKYANILIHNQYVRDTSIHYLCLVLNERALVQTCQDQE